MAEKLAQTTQATANIINLTEKSQLGILAYALTCSSTKDQSYALRSMLEEIDKDYYLERDRTTEHVRARLSNRHGDTTRFQNHEVPVVLPQVESFVAHMSNVFLTGEPLFGVVANAKYADAAMQMEALTDMHANMFSWKQEFIKLFRNLGKYNLGALEVAWDKVYVPSFGTDADTGNATVSNIAWEGNAIKCLDMYNTFWDKNVPADQVALYGEYAGYVEIITRTKFKQLVLQHKENIITQNLGSAFESGFIASEYYMPQVNPSALVNYDYDGRPANENWLAWVGLSEGKSNTNYKHSYVLKTLYARILPSEFGIKVPQQNTPQVWKFLIINNSVLIYAERITNAHNYLPILLASPQDDGLKYQTKSIASNVAGVQHLTTALMNSMIAARRRAVSDRALYNPLYLTKEDVNNTNPGAKIPIKPTGYINVGFDQMYKEIPFRDDQSAYSTQSISMLLSFADNITGQNKAQQGQFVKGNKTLHEYNDIMGNADARTQLAAIAIESQLFTPFKHIIKSNILQYQTATEVYHEVKERAVDIDPVALRNAVLSFKISDGLTPKDKLINGEQWSVAMQTIASAPQIGQGYDIAGMFSYLMKTQGADIRQFEKSPEQRQYDAAVAQWQQVAQYITDTNAKMMGKEGYKEQTIPPQPKPADYGLNPDGKPAERREDRNQASILTQVMMANSQQATNEE